MRSWTTSELKVMRLFAGLGVEAVAHLLDRSQSAVSKAAAENRISLKVTREDIEISNEVLSLLERVSETSRLQICPMCGRRWATMRETGVCRPCHLDRLISLHQEQVDVEMRQRALTAARKEKQRRLAETE